ncbi:Hypothetical predicted protein [Paramuricea clavata]|uniref:Uncharacterized protein n=1 Tax=Paramuricea clavata TaxID=317549 RepID=A0A7D9LCI2_PARCT|nr:Hypothetical predicted protein [Paramuricea clavata]
MYFIRTTIYAVDLFVYFSVQLPSTTISTTSATTETTTQAHSLAQPKNCPHIKKIKKGFVNGSGVIPGSKRTFSCYNHWKLSGSSETTCLNNGQWSKPLPTCKLKGPVINCKALGKIEGGYATKNYSFHGGKVVFKCNANYVMVGKPAVLCKSGKWIRNPPKCYAPCKRLAPPQNGLISTQSGVKHKDVIVFDCDHGYTLQGTAFLQCKDGSWNRSPPICQK